MADGESSMPRLAMCEISGGQIIAKSHRSTVEVLHLTGERHSVQTLQADAEIRTICLASNATYLCCGCDDKSFVIWRFEGESYSRLIKLPTPKRPCAITFTTDSKWVIVADKYGDVYGFCLDELNNIDKPILLFGHLCTVISALGTTSDGSYIFSGDCDGKIRVSLIPPEVEKGVHEIQSFCLSHESRISAVVELSSLDSRESILISGGGDGLLKAWNFEAGDELASYNFNKGHQCLTHSSGDERDSNSCEIVAIESLHSAGHIVVALNSVAHYRNDLHIMRMDMKDGNYRFHHQYHIDTGNIATIGLCYSSSLGELWTVGHSAKVSIYKSDSACSCLSLVSSEDESIRDFCAEDEELRNASTRLASAPWKRRRAHN